jgi:hypothetical protein
MRITFDTNVFQPAVRPDRSQSDPDHAAFAKIKKALMDGTVRGFIPETIADLEAVKKIDRKSYFSAAKPSVTATAEGLPDGRIALRMTVGPSKGSHPGINKFHEESFKEAIALGLRFMHCPRIGLPRPDQLDPSWFATENSDELRGKRQEAFFDAVRAIEAKGVGRAIVENIGNKHAKASGRDMTWYQGLALAPTSLDKAIVKGIAEWADGDAVAAHIGYGNDVFCTRDVGKTAGRSILDATHQAWLQADFGVVFKTPAEVALLI